MNVYCAFSYARSIIPYYTAECMSSGRESQNRQPRLHKKYPVLSSEFHAKRGWVAADFSTDFSFNSGHQLYPTLVVTQPLICYFRTCTSWICTKFVQIPEPFSTFLIHNKCSTCILCHGRFSNCGDYGNKYDYNYYTTFEKKLYCSMHTYSRQANLVLFRVVLTSQPLLQEIGNTFYNILKNKTAVLNLKHRHTL